MHILVADPNVAFGTLLSEELLRLGYSVDQVTSSEEAVHRAEETTPSLAVLDMALEAPDALTLASELRILDESMRLMLIPLIGESLEVEDHSVTIQGVLPKPFFLPELPERIQAVLGTGVVEEQNFQTLYDMEDEPEVTAIQDDLSPALDAGLPTVQAEENDIPIVLPPNQGFGRYEVNKERVKHLMSSLLFEVAADSAILTLGDELLDWVGSFSQDEAESIAKLVIHGWRSSEEVARILGREQLRFEQSIAGGSYMLYALSVDVNAILAVAIRGTATLGMIRHRAREIAGQISALCTTL